MRPGDLAVLCHELECAPSTPPRTDYGRGRCRLPTVSAVTRFLLACLMFLATCAPVAAVDVIADDLADEYVVSGAVLLDSSFPDAQQAATCAECQWRVVQICESGDLDSRRGCDQLPLQCPSAIAEVWFAATATPPAPGDAAWEYRGLMCLDSAPVPATSVSAVITDVARQLVPPLRPGSVPAAVSLTNLPTAFHTGQPPAFTAAPMNVAGTTVVLHLRPQWRWDFGQGTPLVTEDAGQQGPASAIRHKYSRRGTYLVRVDATWHATYDVNGIRGLAVPSDIHQSGWFTIRIREARRFQLPVRSTK